MQGANILALPYEYLTSQGAHEITEEEKQTEWYKREMETLACPFTDEEF